QQDEVVDQLPFESHVAADEIVELDRARLDREADHTRLGGRPAEAGRYTPALSGVAPLLARALRGGALLLELLDRAVAAIGLAAFDELRSALAISLQPIALINRAFVPLHAEPLQRADDLFRVMLARALNVCVLDAEQHRAAVTARVEEIEDRGARAADVQESGRRRSEAELHAAGECAMIVAWRSQRRFARRWCATG